MGGGGKLDPPLNKLHEKHSELSFSYKRKKQNRIFRNPYKFFGMQLASHLCTINCINNYCRQ